MSADDLYLQRLFRKIEILEERSVAEKKRNAQLLCKISKLQHGSGFHWYSHRNLRRDLTIHIAILYIITAMLAIYSILSYKMTSALTSTSTEL